jgi:hypothetical protein
MRSWWRIKGREIVIIKEVIIIAKISFFPDIVSFAMNV